MNDIAKLYETYAASVFRFALYLSGNRSLAEDITSETFVRAWTSSTPTELATVKGYLFTIARRLYLQSLRSRGRSEALSAHQLDLGATPLAQAVSKDEFQRVRAGLLQLSEIDRTALLMRALDEMPYEEIARALGISLASVKVKIHRARVALSKVREGGTEWN